MKRAAYGAGKPETSKYAWEWIWRAGRERRGCGEEAGAGGEAGSGDRKAEGAQHWE